MCSLLNYFPATWLVFRSLVSIILLKCVMANNSSPRGVLETILYQLTKRKHGILYDHIIVFAYDSQRANSVHILYQVIEIFVLLDHIAHRESL